MAINELVFDHRESDHVDDRRALLTIFNGGDFLSRQVKLLDVFMDAQLGGKKGHWHDYREMYFVQRGSALWVLEDTETRERRKIQMSAGDRLIIPARVAHIVQLINAGSLMIGCTEQPYVSSAHNDRDYEVNLDGIDTFQKYTS